MRAIGLLWLVACGGPDPGERGDEDCAPVPVRDRCAVWLCYTAVYPDEVVWHVESGSLSWECDEADCGDALDDAAFEVCGQVLGDTGA